MHQPPAGQAPNRRDPRADRPAAPAIHPHSRTALLALATAVVTVVVVVMAAVGFRLEWWSYSGSLDILRGAVLGGAASIVLAMAGIRLAWPGRRRRGLVISIMALLIAAPTLLMPLHWAYAKWKLPPIQDISTDLESPPEFWDAPTSRLYPGPDTAAQQRTAYPDIQPVEIALPIGDVFAQAVDLVHEREWKLVTAAPDEGRIEATVTTFWYGFKDDVAIRLMPSGAGTRVDMRSTSRFGFGGDGGSNANRIREYLTALKARLAG